MDCYTAQPDSMMNIVTMAVLAFTISFSLMYYVANPCLDSIIEEFNFWLDSMIEEVERYIREL